VFEEGVKKGLDEKFRFFNNETLKLLEIVLAATCCIYEAFYEAINTEAFTP
jgi:hypothetical protein